MSIRGTVLAAPMACTALGGIGGGGQPLVGAKVTVVCPDNGVTLSAESDGAGRFAAAREGAMDTRCAIHVEKDGYETKSYAVADLCAVGGFDSCVSLGVQAELTATSR